MSSSTTAIAWFDEHAEQLQDRYAAERVNTPFVQQLRADLADRPCDILDIGAGTGAVAAMLAGDGHRVVAAEPSAVMRRLGRATYPADLFTMIDDCLPDLDAARALNRSFDVVTEIAVHMFMDDADRQAGFTTAAALLRPGGSFYTIMKLDADEPDRGCYPVPLEEPLALAAANRLDIVRHGPAPDVLGRPIRWHGYVFRKPAI